MILLINETQSASSVQDFAGWAETFGDNVSPLSQVAKPYALKRFMGEVITDTWIHTWNPVIASTPHEIVRPHGHNETFHDCSHHILD